MLKINISKDQLLVGVNAVIRTVPSKPANSYLAGIHLKAETRKLTFTATDLNMTTQCTIDTEVEIPGEVVVPAKIFSDFIKKLPDTSIGIEVGENGQMTVNYFFSSVNFNCLPAEEFPLISNTAAETIAISVGALRKAIRQTTFATAEGNAAETRPVFGGVFFDLTEDGSLSIVATDTHRMAVKRSTGVSSKVAKSVIVPSKAVDEVFRLLKDDDDTCLLGLGEDFVTFGFGSNQIYARLVAGSYPAYKNVLPQSAGTSLQLSTKNFADALERASVLTKGESKVVSFSFDDSEDKLVITSQSDKGKILEMVPITNKNGDKCKVAFNAILMTEALKVLDTEEAILELNGPNGPGVLKAMGDDSYIYLALPLRIAS